MRRLFVKILVTIERPRGRDDFLTRTGGEMQKASTPLLRMLCEPGLAALRRLIHRP
jgi:hypothetical protein